jgi:hypothetical protein
MCAAPRDVRAIGVGRSEVQMKLEHHHPQLLLIIHQTQHPIEYVPNLLPVRWTAKGNR